VARAVDGQDAVIHVAAKVAVTGAWNEFEHVNITGTETLLTAARRSGVGRFVHVSTPSVAHAGHALIGAQAEPADPRTTRGHYATSKAEAERRALAASTPDCPVVAIRPHLVWGPGDEQLVGRIVGRARSGRLALIGSGAALIDTTYVDNAADALVAALDAAPRLGGQSLVVSNGEPRTVHELVGRILRAHGLAPPTHSVPTRVAFGGGLLLERWWGRSSRASEPPMTSFLAEQLSTAHWFDQRTTRSSLSWKPAISLDEGFQRLGSWVNRPG
jgi:nucleoside-diphosphate-sugar epimerase